MNIIAIPLDRIDLGDRLRAVDEEYAQLIAASMQEDGQRTPVEVQARADAESRYRLIAGGHRFRAAQIAGLTELLAVVLRVSDLDAQRLEIEENLCRQELTELDRAVFLARWQVVYDAIEHAPRHGGGRKGAKFQVSKLAHLIEGDAPPPRFTAVASARLGLSEAHIRRAKRRADIVPEARAKLAGTWIADNGSALDGICRLKPPYQVRVADLALARPDERSFAALRLEALQLRQAVPDVDQVQFDALVKAWRRAGAKARRMFQAELARDAQFNLEDAE
jgi:ParB family chromosome partitioning protein